MTRRLAFLVVCAAISASCSDQNPPSEDDSGDAPTSAIVGVWQAVEVTEPDSTGAQSTRPSQPGLRIFTPKHYSVLTVNSTAPRAVLPDSNATETELAAAWGPFSANSGTYEIVSDTLITHPSVAKNPNVMAPGYYAKLVYRLGGDTLRLTNAGNSVSPTVTNPPTTTWVRVE